MILFPYENYPLTKGFWWIIENDCRWRIVGWWIDDAVNIRSQKTSRYRYYVHASLFEEKREVVLVKDAGVKKASVEAEVHEA